MTTIEDVARAAKVSSAVVSSIINNEPYAVSPEMEARVRQAMEALDFQPNLQSLRAAKRRSDCIGLIFNGLADPHFDGLFFSEYTHGIITAAEKAGFNITLFLRRGREFYKRVHKASRVDGLILAGSSLPSLGLAQIALTGFPAVLIGQRVPGIAWVTQDDKGATYTATRYLLDQGYRRIGLLGQAVSLSYGQDRLDGYRQALIEAGIAFAPQFVSVPAQPRDVPSFEEVRTLVQAGVDALLTDKEIVVAAYLRQLDRLVPEQIGLIGLDEDKLEARSQGITTLWVSKFDIGVTATEMLIDLINKKADVLTQQTFPMRLHVRDSCRHQVTNPDTPTFTA